MSSNDFISNIPPITKLLSKCFSLLSHEIRSPLSIALQFVRDNKAGIAITKEDIEDALAALKQINMLADQLKSMSRWERVELKHISLSDVCKAIDMRNLCPELEDICVIADIDFLKDVILRLGALGVIDVFDVEFNVDKEFAYFVFNTNKDNLPFKLTTDEQEVLHLIDDSMSIKLVPFIYVALKINDMQGVLKVKARENNFLLKIGLRKI